MRPCRGGRPGQPRSGTSAHKPGGKWLTASVPDDIPAVIAAAFDETQRRDPGHHRPWVALVDGNTTQLDNIQAEAIRHQGYLVYLVRGEPTGPSASVVR